MLASTEQSRVHTAEAEEASPTEWFTSFEVPAQATMHLREPDWDPAFCVQVALQRSGIYNPTGRLLRTQVEDFPGQIAVEPISSLHTHRTVVVICQNCAPAMLVCAYPYGASIREFLFGLVSTAHPWHSWLDILLASTCSADNRNVPCSQSLPADVDADLRHVLSRRETRSLSPASSPKANAT